MSSKGFPSTSRGLRSYYRTFLYHNYRNCYYDKFHLLTYFEVNGNQVSGYYCDQKFSYMGSFENVLHSVAMDSIESDRRSHRTGLKEGLSSQDPGVGSVLAGAAAASRLVKVPNVRGGRIGMLQASKHGAFRKEIREAFPNINFNKYQHSSKITGTHTSKKLHKLYQGKASKIEQEITEKGFLNKWAMSVLMNITYDGKGGVLYNTPVSEEHLEYIPLKDASNAYPDIAFNPDGVKMTSKREEATLTKAQIMISERYGIIPLNTYKPAKKGEVIETLGKPDKRGCRCPKDCRYIYCCCTMEFVSFAASGLYDQMAAGQNTSDARTLPTIGGMYHDLVHRLTRSVDGTFEEKEASLNKEVFSIDFSGWEYKFGLFLKLIYFLGIMATLNEVRYPYSLAGAVASVLCPIVVIDGAMAVLAYDLMPSGTLPTLDLNCFGNNFITKSFIQDEIPDLEDAVKILDSKKHGDDLVSRVHRWVQPLQDYYEDVFGMSVAQVENNSFLQRTIDFDNRVCVYPLERLLNKIYHSPGTAEDKRQQVYSYYQLAGGHFEEFRKLRDIVGRPETFASKADGDLLGFYNEAIEDDQAVVLLHEPRDPHDVLLRFAFEDIHNSTPDLMRRRVDLARGRKLFESKYGYLLRK